MGPVAAKKPARVERGSVPTCYGIKKLKTV